MNYIIMDLEFNQPFDFDRGEKTTLVQECPFEIIQIGIVKTDDAFTLSNTRNIMIKPQLYKRMHPFVEKITGLRADMFEEQRTFPEIYSELLTFIGEEEAVLCVWGSSDIKLLYKNIMYYKLDYSGLTRRYINVQKLASQFLKLPNGMSIGLKNAAESLEIPTKTNFHDALNDAVYTAEIFKMLKKDNITMEVYNPADLTNEKGKVQHEFNAKLLYAEAEKLFGRRLTRKEKEIIKKVYTLGRFKKFDFRTCGQ